MNKTYFLRFAGKHGYQIEEREFAHSEDAWAAFRQLADPHSAEKYTAIELTEYDLDTDEDTLIAALEFAAN